ncbi:MAG: hypothetical protein ABIL09_03320 [Gemmatimonadota bacterium]
MTARARARRRSWAVAASLAWLAAAGPARAHKVSVYAMAEGDSVLAEAYFADGAPCVGSTITVYDTAGAELAAARTDSAGRASFPRLRADGLKLVLYAGMGHRDEFQLTAEDLGPAVAPAGRTGSPAPTAPAPAAGGALAGGNGTGGELARQVEAAVERRLGPLEAAVRRLEKSQERAGFREVVGGLGYILGLAGLWAWLTSRRR